MVLSQLETVAWILTPPTVLLLALNTASFVYRSYVTRALATLSVAVSAAFVIATIKISSPSLAFMTGLLEGWMVIWSAVLLLHYNPPAQARRRRWTKVPNHDGEFEISGQIWQRYPARDWKCRLEWTVGLLIGFRGVGWKLAGEDEGGRSNNPAIGDTPKNSPFEKPSLFVALIRLVRDYTAFQAVLWSADLLKKGTNSAWQLQALHTATWLSSSILFINSCHSSWGIIGALSQWAGPSEMFCMDHYNPSPWGPIGAVVEQGLAGLWGATWHNYFKFGFQSASDLAVPGTTNTRLKSPLRLLRMVWSFLLSGAIHCCGSYMLPGPTRPSKELLFFALQGVAVVFQLAIYDRLVWKKYRRISNPILVAAWLYWTEPLIFGDQRDGGMWRL